MFSMFSMTTALSLCLKNPRPTQLTKDNVAPPSLGGLFDPGGILKERKLEVSPPFSRVAFK